MVIFSPSPSSRSLARGRRRFHQSLTLHLLQRSVFQLSLNLFNTLPNPRKVSSQSYWRATQGKGPHRPEGNVTVSTSWRTSLQNVLPNYTKSGYGDSVTRSSRMGSPAHQRLSLKGTHNLFGITPNIDWNLTTRFWDR